MGDLELQTAVEKVGEGCYRAHLDRDWAIWGPNGGYLASIALRAAGAESRFRRPASFLCQFLSVASFEEVELRVETLRAGRTTQALRVSMQQRDRRILEALVWTVAPNQGLVHDFTRPPAVPPPEDLPSMEELLARDGRKGHGFWKNYETRPIDGLQEGKREPGEPRIRGWYRFRPRARCEDPFADAARSLVLIDTYSWASVWAAHPSDGPLPFIAPNLDLHVRFHRSAADSEWLFCEGRADLAEEGLIGADMRVWSREGKLLASGASHLYCRPRPERFR
jgi:acyl-CoA thioesterase II